MPATQRGQAYKLGPGHWGLRYYDEDGIRRRKSPFSDKTAALNYYRDVIEPKLRGESAKTRDHARRVDRDLRGAPRDRCAPAHDLRRSATGCVIRQSRSGTRTWADLERMSDEIAGLAGAATAGVPGHGDGRALRQVLDAAVRWGYISRNPAKLAGSNPRAAAARCSGLRARRDRRDRR